MPATGGRHRWLRRVRRSLRSDSLSVGAMDVSTTFDSVFRFRYNVFPPHCLPTGVDVMRVVFFNMHDLDHRMSLNESARCVGKMLRVRWLEENRASMSLNAVVTKIKKVHDTFCKVRRDESRPCYHGRLDAFKSDMNAVFDIGAKDSVGVVPARAVKRQALRQSGEVKKRQRKCQDNTPQAAGDVVKVEVEVYDSDPDPEFLPGTSLSAVPSSVCTNLDRGKVSSRAAFRTLAAKAAEDGDEHCLSHTTLWRRRREERSEAANTIRATFAPKGPQTVHWDGIKVPRLDGKRGANGKKELVERLPVVVSGSDGNEQLLSADVLPDGTGEAQATAVMTQLECWKCGEKVTVACADTTSSITGPHNGAIVILEEKLGKILIYTACRHHLLETIPKHVFHKTVEPSTSPDLGPLCTSFMNKWNSMDHTNYLPATQDSECKEFLPDDKILEILNFAKNTLKRPLIRCDYKYLLELVVIFLGEVPPTQPNGVHFRSPMALSSARFMGRIIYCLSMHMFALTGEFQVTPATLTKLRNFNLFHVMNYLEPWFSATNGIEAPLNDLRLLHNIIEHAEVNVLCSKVAREAFVNHLWYLSPHCVPFALFDDRVGHETKRAMVANLTKKVKEAKRANKSKKSKKSKKKSRGIPDRPPMRYLAGEKTPVSRLRQLRLPQFVNEHSMLFFSAFGLETSFLTKDPQEWESDPVFKENQSKLRNVQVVNDTAERSVALCKNFNGELTRDEKDFQNLLLVQKKVKSEEQDNSLRVTYFCPKLEE
ncbi:uncharacterized protein LOC117642402 [Thrips palmi]|uniref:Uncharacterized protein LOC117642402 n=1 Tax=Thrips palmi TaxID=161013 RepID=A0A6P8ZK44_THRPL|nr:uncharacterized protein LOC117642402 [Thrips palmi]